LLKALAALDVDATAALYVGDHPVDGHAAHRAGVGFVRVRSGEDHGVEGWAGIQPLATIDHVGGLPGVLDRL
jgi:phosphoglycolate phosphatase-like HAD superfamily hydrolase